MWLPIKTRCQAIANVNSKNMCGASLHICLCLGLNYFENDECTEPSIIYLRSDLKHFGMLFPVPATEAMGHLGCNQNINHVLLCAHLTISILFHIKINHCYDKKIKTSQVLRKHLLYMEMNSPLTNIALYINTGKVNILQFLGSRNCCSSVTTCLSLHLNGLLLFLIIFHFILFTVSWDQLKHHKMGGKNKFNQQNVAS